MSVAEGHSLRGVVRLVATLNLAYFGIEFAIARAIGSVLLFADSIDFLEDASINFLIVIALGWTARSRARVGMAMAGILLVPGIATLWTAWEKFNAPVAPDPVLLSLTGAGALTINLSCALMLARYRHVAIIAAGLVTAYTLSAWADLIVGLGIALLNADAAREVWKAARDEHQIAEA